MLGNPNNGGIEAVGIVAKGVGGQKHYRIQENIGHANKKNKPKEKGNYMQGFIGQGFWLDL